MGAKGQIGSVFWNGVEHSYIPPAELSIDPSVVLHEDAAPFVDPITYEVIRYALMSTNFEHADQLRRLCVSPVTMISLDFQASLLLEQGDLVFLGPNIQYFSNSQSFTVKWILEHRSGNPGIHPDDMFLANDPYVGAPHQSDTCVAAPVFVDGRLYCWVANVVHHADVGGTSPGSFCLGATDSWGDPPNFPPIKIVERGTIRDDVEQLFVRQSRMPSSVRMDLRAAISSNEYAKARLLAVVKRYGPEVVKAVMRRVLDVGERVFTERLASIPDGSWCHRAYTEVAVPGDRGVYAFQVNVHKRGDRLYVDNYGTAKQAGSLNCPYVAFVGAVLCAITQQMTSDLAGAYGGVYRRVTFEPVPGTMSCPDHPAAVSPSGAYSTEINIHAASLAIGKMLACGDAAARHLILGPTMVHPYGIVYSGLDDAGDMFIMVNSNQLGGPGPGSIYRDGLDAGGQYWVPGAIAYNVEDVEEHYPVLYLYKRMLPGGVAGAGRKRGGPGVVEGVIPWRARELTLQLYSNENFTKGAGLFGGNPNGRAWLHVRRDSNVTDLFDNGTIPQDFEQLTGTDVRAEFKGDPLPIGPDDVFEFDYPTSPGCGDPLLRDPAEVLRDVGQGCMSADDAFEAYGVVLGPDRVDADATSRERARRLERRATLSVVPPGSPGTSAASVGITLGRLDDRFVCMDCGTDIGPANQNYKHSSAVHESPISRFDDGSEPADRDVNVSMVFREYCCPGCGVRFDTEIGRASDEPLWDVWLVSDQSDVVAGRQP